MQAGGIRAVLLLLRLCRSPPRRGEALCPAGALTVCSLPASPGEDPERRGQCPAPHVPEGAAVLPPLPTEHGECQAAVPRGQPWRVGRLVP